MTEQFKNIAAPQLKLQFSFFTDKRVNSLRRKYGGDALIIYQKMMLKSLENDGLLKYEGLEDTFYEEVATDIMEESWYQVIELIIEFLTKHDLMIKQEDGSFFFPQAKEISG